jgi:FdrA protein
MKKPTEDGKPQTMTPARSLITQPINVINVGLDGFAEELESQGVKVTRVDWSPPAGGDAKLAALLSKLGT